MQYAREILHELEQLVARTQTHDPLPAPQWCVFTVLTETGNCRSLPPGWEIVGVSTVAPLNENRVLCVGLTIKLRKDWTGDHPPPGHDLWQWI